MLDSGDRVPKQCRDRHVMGASEWPQGEGHGGEHAIEHRQRQAGRIDGRCKRQRQHRAKPPGNDVRQRRSDNQARYRSDDGERNDLHEIDLEHRETGSTERFQRGDGVTTTVEMALDGIGDANPADDQRGQSDQRQILGEAFDVPSHGRRSARAGANLPAGFRQLLLRGVGHGLHRRVAAAVVGEPHAVVPAHDAAGLDEPGGAQRRLADQETRPKPDSAGELVRLRFQGGAQLDRSGADHDAVARFEVEPRQQGRVGRCTEHPVALGERTCQRLGGVESRPSRRVDRPNRPP